MNSFYEWLYEHYAKPQLANSQLSPVYFSQNEEWKTVAAKLSRHDYLLTRDLMNTFRDDWGTLAFACGIQVGLSLSADPFAAAHFPAPRSLMI